MDIDISAWPELLFKFGPYAILALFILWVTPRASKRMQDLTKSAPKPVRVSATITLIASWAVVLVMVGYVLFKWSPVRVYEGTLGVLKQSEAIYPLDDNVYVKMEGTRAPGREKWKFVLVDSENNLKKQDKVYLTYYWGEQENQYTDYSIPVGAILDGSHADFRLTQKIPEAEFTWNAEGWKQASAEPGRTVPMSAAWIRTAHADDGLNRIARNLGSVNRVLRAEARKNMRRLSSEQLKELKQLTNDELALHQIELELSRRGR